MDESEGRYAEGNKPDTEGQILHDSTYRGLQSGQNQRGRKSSGGSQGLGEGGLGGLVFNRDRVSVWEDKKVLDTDYGDDCATMQVYLMPLSCTLEKWLQWLKIIIIMCLVARHGKVFKK